SNWMTVRCVSRSGGRRPDRESRLELANARTEMEQGFRLSNGAKPSRPAPLHSAASLPAKPAPAGFAKIPVPHFSTVVPKGAGRMSRSHRHGETRENAARKGCESRRDGCEKPDPHPQNRRQKKRETLR